MSDLRRRMEVKRILQKYPMLTNFMQGAWNEQYDLLFSSIEEAAEWYMRLITEQMGRDFLEELDHATEDKGFWELMRDPHDSVELAIEWGGMVLSDARFRELKAAIRRCLDEGIFVSKQEEQRRAMRNRWR